MRARILSRKPNPGNRGGLHYSQFRRYLATQASQIQLLAFRPRRENRRPLSPIREVGLTQASPLPIEVGGGRGARSNPRSWKGKLDVSFYGQYQGHGESRDGNTAQISTRST